MNLHAWKRPMVAIVIQRWVALNVNPLHCKRSTVRLIFIVFLVLVIYSFVDAIKEYLPWLLGSSAVRSCFWMDMCEACTYLCCLCLSLFVWILLDVSSFFNAKDSMESFIKILWNSWSYSSTLAYLVDANNGRSSTTVALNSTFRGCFAFVATEITVPLQVCTAFLVL